MRAAAGGLALLLASCGAEPGWAEREIAVGVALPAFRNFAAAAAELARAAEAGVDLDDLRLSWKAARVAWCRCLPYLIGPEAERLLTAKIDTFPAADGKIDVLPALDDEALERLGADVKGFFALEALLFSPGPRNARLVPGLARNLALVAREIAEGWEGFAERSTRPEARRAFVDLLLNHLVLTAQGFCDRIARPSGFTAEGDGRPRPELSRARKSGHTLPEARATLEGLRALYERGLRARVVAASPELDAAIREAIDGAERSLAGIPEPFEAALDTRREELRVAVGALRNLQNRIAIDLVSVYRTTLTVSPFDGD
jgi:predicted lipoprotein